MTALDAALESMERYTRAGLVESMERAGLKVEHVREFNRISVPAWWFNGRVKTQGFRACSSRPGPVRAHHQARRSLHSLDGAGA